MLLDHPAISDEERTVPDAVIEAANYGLSLRRQHKRGGTEVGLERALRLSRGEKVSDRDIKVMNAWFARHAVDKRGKFWGIRPNHRRAISHGTYGAAMRPMNG